MLLFCLINCFFFYYSCCGGKNTRTCFIFISRRGNVQDTKIIINIYINKPERRPNRSASVCFPFLCGGCQRPPTASATVWPPPPPASPGAQPAVQQQPPLASTLRLLSILTALGASAALEGGPTRFLISAAIVMNACSTLVAFFADVSRNGMPSWFAYSCEKWEGVGKEPSLSSL